MRPASFPDRRRRRLQAGIFASDLQALCDEVFQVFAGRKATTTVDGMACELLRLPITIPADEQGHIVLGPGRVDGDRKPASMEVVRVLERRARYRFGIAFGRTDGAAMLIPGVNHSGRDDEPPAPVHELEFAMAEGGFAVTGFGPDGQPVPLTITEPTARELATALLITLGVKLEKARRGLE